MRRRLFVQTVKAPPTTVLPNCSFSLEIVLKTARNDLGKN